MPWRNGGGLTRELLAWPDAGDWAWRLSVAEVAQDGPFSRFDGVERWFAVLSGHGVCLDIEGQTHKLTAESAPLCFDAATLTSCTLMNGATQDFNLMLRRDRARAHMLRVAGVRQCILAKSVTLAVYGVQGPGRLRSPQGESQLSAGTLLWQRLDAGALVQLDAPHALWMEIEA